MLPRITTEAIKARLAEQADMQEGQRWARLYLPMLRYVGGPPALGWIVNAMIEAGGERNGLVCGFMHEIAEHAAVGAAVWGYIDRGDRGPAA